MLRSTVSPRNLATTQSLRPSATPVPTPKMTPEQCLAQYKKQVESCNPPFFWPPMPQPGCEATASGMLENCTLHASPSGPQTCYDTLVSTLRECHSIDPPQGTSLACQMSAFPNYAACNAAAIPQARTSASSASLPAPAPQTCTEAFNQAVDDCSTDPPRLPLCVADAHLQYTKCSAPPTEKSSSYPPTAASSTTAAASSTSTPPVNPQPASTAKPAVAAPSSTTTAASPTAANSQSTPATSTNTLALMQRVILSSGVATLAGKMANTIATKSIAYLYPNFQGNSAKTVKGIGSVIQTAVETTLITAFNASKASPISLGMLAATLTDTITEYVCPPNSPHKEYIKSSIHSAITGIVCASLVAGLVEGGAIFGALAATGAAVSVLTSLGYNFLSGHADKLLHNVRTQNPAASTTSEELEMSLLRNAQEPGGSVNIDMSGDTAQTPMPHSAGDLEQIGFVIVDINTESPL